MLCCCKRHWSVKTVKNNGVVAGVYSRSRGSITGTAVVSMGPSSSGVGAGGSGPKTPHHIQAQATKYINSHDLSV